MWQSSLNVIISAFSPRWGKLKRKDQQKCTVLTIAASAAVRGTSGCPARPAMDWAGANSSMMKANGCVVIALTAMANAVGMSNANVGECDSMSGFACRTIGFEHRESGSPDVSQPIYFTKGFRQDVEWVFGGLTTEDTELAAMAFVIPGSAVFYKCIALPKVTMDRERGKVAINSGSREVMEVVARERYAKNGHSFAELIHIHNADCPFLSPCDITTYENDRQKRQSPLGVGKPYPVLLVNQHEASAPSLLGFWVMEGVSYKTEIRCVDDAARLVRDAWTKGTQI